MHWKREFESWTDINVIVYQGTQNDRNIIRHFEFRFWNEVIILLITILIFRMAKKSKEFINLKFY